MWYLLPETTGMLGSAIAADLLFLHKVWTAVLRCTRRLCLLLMIRALTAETTDHRTSKVETALAHFPLVV